jgi:hypothetical protein
LSKTKTGAAKPHLFLFFRHGWLVAQKVTIYCQAALLVKIFYVAPAAENFY